MNKWLVRVLIFSMLCNFYLYYQARWFADRAIKEQQDHLESVVKFNKLVDDLYADMEERKSVKK